MARDPKRRIARISYPNGTASAPLGLMLLLFGSKVSEVGNWPVVPTTRKKRVKASQVTTYGVGRVAIVGVTASTDVTSALDQWTVRYTGPFRALVSAITTHNTLGARLRYIRTEQGSRVTRSTPTV